tara:strand:- start:5145 stop:5390 length:246 start_codon:yes stop_codon:yes gene_type:complete
MLPYDAYLDESIPDHVLQLLADLVDPDDCWFDHRGGCQAHGYLDLEPGVLCPHHEAKQLLVEHKVIERECDESAINGIRGG